MANVLLIGINYAPEVTGMAVNNVDMAARLRDAGHSVAVMTAMPHYPRWSVPLPYRGHLRYFEVLDGVLVTRFANYVPSRQSALRRGLYEFTFLANALLSRLHHKPDVVVGIVPALAGAYLARHFASRASAQFGVIFGDLMGKAAGQAGVPGGSQVSGLVRRLELTIARSAEAVGIISDGFREYLVDGGVTPARVHRIVNRNRAPTHKPTTSRDEIRQQMRWGDHEFVVLHSGNIGYKQGLETVVRAAALTSLQDSLRFVLLGDGNQRRDLAHLAMQLGVENLDFEPLVPTADFDNVLAAADILLVNQKGTVTDMSLPGKVTAYFAAGVPVVASVAAQSETAKEVSRSGAGLLVAPDSPRELLDAIRRLRSDTRLYRELAISGPAYASEYLANAEKMDINRFVETLLVRPVTHALH